MGNELWRMGAAALAQAIRAKDVSSREVVEAHLARIDAVNPRVNAVVAILADEALAAADRADAAIAAGDDVGALHGVPITVKENVDVAGTAFTQGVRAMADAISDQDAPHIKQLRAAGAIPMGRTNLPEFGMRFHTDNDLHGPTKNPWDASRTPGGSSGGEAVAQATGMSPLGVGTDIGGSLRVPAQFCGIASLRPTMGRIPMANAIPAPEPPITRQLMAVQGPMARSVRDVRLGFENMCGPDPRDPWWTPAPLRGPALPTPIRVAVSVNPGGNGVHPDVADGVRAAAAALSDAGYAVEEVDPPALDRTTALWSALLFADVNATLAPIMRDTASADAQKVLGFLVEANPALDLEGYRAALGERYGIAREWAQFQAERPLILGPVSTNPPFTVGEDLKGLAESNAITESMRLVVTINLLGLPAAAVPVGVANGLPQGVQIIGPRFREDLCLDAAQAVEDRLPMPTPIDPRG